MKCPKCQFDNPEGAKFCGECGAKLERICPKCNSSNPPEFKFCGECGHNLTIPSEPTPKDLSFDEKLDKIQRYLPKGLTEKILAQRDRIEGERKQVTVMFCDMERFILLVERLGPEEAYAIMDQVYEILIYKVHNYEGTVNEMTGDGIVALFGAPIALEDAPQRAIRSAYAIHREMVKFSDKIKQEKEGIPPLRMRIGIHTGPVVVGTLGNDLRVEFKAVGDTVNLASRMEGLAEPGTTYVTEKTFKLTEGFFRFEALGEKEVKGKEKTIKTYCVIAPSTRRTRFDVSAEQGLTPFVGRERELELLLDGFERSKYGRGQAFSIMSEAGVGKSRLLYEFRKAVANEDVTFLEGKCLSYSRGVAYHPVIDILKSSFDIQDTDGDMDIREKVKRGLNTLGEDESSTLPYLLELLSVKNSGIDKIPMSPEAKKERIIDALNRNVLKGSEIRPVVMAVEDLHWIDKSSEERFKSLLDCISGARVFLLFTYRPEFVHTWGGRSYHSQVNLTRLSNRESIAMVSHLLGSEEIESGFEDFILEKTEGVPFFIEEFIKSLKDLQIIERKENTHRIGKNIQALTIPETIQDVIMARVDSLPEGAKELLQTGSVIEREFSYALIKQVTGLSERELLSHLSVLKDSELLYERGIYPQSTFIFNHALTKEVVYDSILTARKKRLHEEIGNAIEELYKDNIDEHYGILAQHYITSENYEKGAEYSRLAGKKAEKGAFFTDAIAHAEKAVNCFERLSLNDDLQLKLIDARTSLGLYYNQIMHNLEAKEAVTPVLNSALRLKCKKRISQIYCIIGTCNYWVEENIPMAFNNLKKALKISEEVKDNVSTILACFYLGFALTHDCSFKRGAHFIEKANRINVATNSLWGISIMKSTLSYNACNQGAVKKGFGISTEAIKLAEESGDIFSKSAAYIMHGIAYFHKGLLKEAKNNLLKGADFSRRINHFYQHGLGHDWLGECYFELGEYEKSKYHFQLAVKLKEEGRLPRSWVNLSKICLERAKIMNTDCDIDVQELFHYEAENKIRLYDGWMRRAIGEILLNIDGMDISDGGNWIKKAIEADKGNGTRWFLGKDYALYSEAFKRKNNLPEAKKYLNKAIEVFEECEADGWRRNVEKKLITLSGRTHST